MIVVVVQIHHESSKHGAARRRRVRPVRFLSSLSLPRSLASDSGFRFFAFATPRRAEVFLSRRGKREAPVVLQVLRLRLPALWVLLTPRDAGLRIGTARRSAGARLGGRLSLRGQLLRAAVERGSATRRGTLSDSTATPDLLLTSHIPLLTSSSITHNHTSW